MATTVPAAGVAAAVASPAPVVRMAPGRSWRGRNCNLYTARLSSRRRDGDRGHEHGTARPGAPDSGARADVDSFIGLVAACLHLGTVPGGPMATPAARITFHLDPGAAIDVMV